MDDAGNLARMKCVLLSYVGLIAGRNGFAPGENFEYLLWDTLLAARSGKLIAQREASQHGPFKDTQYVSIEEGDEIIHLAGPDRQLGDLQRRDPHMGAHPHGRVGGPVGEAPPLSRGDDDGRRARARRAGRPDDMFFNPASLASAALTPHRP
jgi:hypothetical protein